MNSSAGNSGASVRYICHRACRVADVEAGIPWAGETELKVFFAGEPPQ